jgi:hypothetical protein
VASRSRKPAPPPPRRVRAVPAATAGSFLPTLENFLLSGEGQVSVGSIGPIPCAAIANDEHNMLAALMRRPDETLQQLLERLDRAVQLALEDEIFTDEINTPDKPKPAASSRR